MEVPVRHLGLRHRGLAPERQDGVCVGTAVAPGQRLQAAVHLGVDPADEEGGHTGHPGQLALASRGDERLEAAQVGLHDLVVAVEPEDERDVDTAAFADQRLNGRHAFTRGRHLDQEVGLGDRVVELPRISHGALGVVRQRGRDFEGDEPVLTVTLVVRRAQQGQGVLDVGGRHLPVRLLDRVVRHQRAELVVVDVFAR